MQITQARESDTPKLSQMLKDLADMGKRSLPWDIAFVQKQYIAHADTISCIIAKETDDTPLGLQILKRARADNPYGVTPGWGIIGTHIHPKSARRGIGRSLFAHTMHAAKEAGLLAIDASIAAHNQEGLAFYAALGFQTYRRDDGRICKKFTMAS